MAKTKADWMQEATALRSDLTIISEELAREAEERSWCPEYSKFVSAVNGLTSEAHLERCAEQVLEGEVTISFSELEVTVESGEDTADAVRRWVIDNVINVHHALDTVESVELGG